MKTFFLLYFVPLFLFFSPSCTQHKKFLCSSHWRNVYIYVCENEYIHTLGLLTCLTKIHLVIIKMFGHHLSYVWSCKKQRRNTPERDALEAKSITPSTTIRRKKLSPHARPSAHWKIASSTPIRMKDGPSHGQVHHPPPYLQLFQDQVI
ncbi:unnamed protein product, partial [Vitis vinifera]|uniref:Secreted protein n=1 Tax=Vitis vinifera TaxID=29760 RepID=D7TY31_VITVI